MPRSPLPPGRCTGAFWRGRGQKKTGAPAFPPSTARGSGQDGSLLYQLRDSRHRHYLICTRCGSSVPIPGCPLEGLERSLGAKTGFAITGHNLELYGLCPQCAKGGKP